MIICAVLISSMTQNCLKKRISTVSWMINIYLMNNMDMRRKFGKHSVSSHWVIIMICILDLMFSFWLIYLKTSEALVCSTTKLTHVIISHLLECHGMLCWRWLTSNENWWLIFQFIEKSMSGGINYIANGFGKARNR